MHRDDEEADGDLEEVGVVKVSNNLLCLIEARHGDGSLASCLGDVAQLLDDSR